MDAVTVGAEQDAADLGTPVALQALLGNGRVAVDLALQGLFHVVQVGFIGKLDDLLHVEQGVVGGLGAGLLHVFFLEQDLAVPLQGDDIGVVACDLRKSGMPAAEQPHLDVKQVGLARALHMDGRLFQEIRHLLQVILRHGAEHFQLLVRIACHDACGSGGRNARRRSCRDAPQSAGMGDYHAFDVLDDVGTGGYLSLLCRAAQCPGSQGSRIGHRDGLGAAHRRHQLFF